MLQQNVTNLDISSFFHHGKEELDGRTSRIERYRGDVAHGVQVTLDCFPGRAVRCSFVRFLPDRSRLVSLALKDRCRMTSIAAGGWLLEPQDDGHSAYWIPQPPSLRELDDRGRILSEKKAEITDLRLTDAASSVEIRLPSDFIMDIVIWQVPSEESDLLTELRSQSTIETQPHFIYASHSSYRRMADVYIHLINGNVYGNNFSWPKHRKICDELDAYALYLVVSALGLSTGKQLYSLIKWQIVLSVIVRQADNGAWNHGEWTDLMESHHRLHCGGIHLLLHALEEEDDEAVRSALGRAVTYLADRADNTGPGRWFLHDSLEESVETMRQSPFPWFMSRALGKAQSNMLVLNTHMDTIIALRRYQAVTGDGRFSDILDSAHRATTTVLNLRSAEILYQLLFKAIYLTLLPENEARALSIPVRAVKRVAWKYVIPNLHYIKAWFPRLAMPGGYIDRALSLEGLAFGYQSVHVWDMSRYLRYYPDGDLEKCLSEALYFTYSSPLRRYWKDPKKHVQHALGFWAEALYHRCMRDRSPQYRAWLAEAMMDIEDIGAGQPPGLLGVNAETSPVSQRHPCPSPREGRLRIANLSRHNSYEILVVNPTDNPLPLVWQDNQHYTESWHGSDGQLSRDSHDLVVPERGWLLGRGEK